MILNETYTLSNGVNIPKLGLGPGSLTTTRRRKRYARQLSSDTALSTPRRHTETSAA